MFTALWPSDSQMGPCLLGLEGSSPHLKVVQVLAAPGLASSLRGLLTFLCLPADVMTMRLETCPSCSRGICPIDLSHCLESSAPQQTFAELMKSIADSPHSSPL